MYHRINKYAITYLLHDNDVLVVGGGKVATRKVKTLLEQGVKRIRVVAKTTTPALEELHLAKRICLEKRAFECSDLDGVALVFTATNHSETNQSVIQAAQSVKIPVCAVDEHWYQGSFITPATTQCDDITVSVSTGGKACRRSRLIKEWVAKHLKNSHSPTLWMIGTDHLHLPIKEREPLHLHGKRYDEVSKILALLSPIHEFMILNTCNRVEIYAILQPSEQIIKSITHIMRLDEYSENQYYTFQGEAAFAHLAKVTAGLLSQTPGENYITAQLKESLTTAIDAGYAGRLLQDVVEITLHTARQIRNTVAPILHCTEIEELALKYIQMQTELLQNQHVMIIGTGVIGQALIQSFTPHTAHITWVYHKNCPTLPEDSSIALCQLNHLKDQLESTDIIITAVDVDNPILHQGHTPFFDIDRKVLAIDLSLPRNIAQNITEMLPQLKLVNLDDLKHWYRREICNMEEIMQLAQHQIDTDQKSYTQFLNSLIGNNHEH